MHVREDFFWKLFQAANLDRKQPEAPNTGSFVDLDFEIQVKSFAW